MSETKSPPHLSLVTGENEETKRLTRAQVAARLGVSVSTVRRYEGDRLHPAVDADGVHTFAPSEVARLARALVAEREASPRARERAVERASELTRGEVAALVFERLEQRQSLAEIVIGLRIPPEDVRALYHVWIKGLWRGELERKDCALPTIGSMEDQGALRRVEPAAFEAMLAALPVDEPTRISVARTCDEWEDDQARWHHVVELGGFTVYGPIDAADLWRRYGTGAYRVTAYGFDPTPGVRWEVVAPLRPPAPPT